VTMASRQISVTMYTCNNSQEITAAQAPGAYPFDAIIIGAGMFGGYCAEKLYRASAGRAGANLQVK
jgi:hypothetical protein